MSCLSRLEMTDSDANRQRAFAGRHEPDATSGESVSSCDCGSCDCIISLSLLFV